MAEGAAALGVPFIRLLADFTAELRAAGLTAGTGDLLAYSQAMSTLDPADLLDLYWAGRATLVNRRDSIATYDTVFRRFFLGAPGPLGEILTLTARLGPEAQSVLEVPATEPPPDPADGTEEEATLGLMASDAEALRHKAFTACTPGELAAVRRIMRRIRLAPPRRRTRRTAAAPAGRSPDLRRMVRESMRTGGEPAGLYWRQRKIRPRPLILILDVSGSMADYSRNLLQFAYSAKRAAARVEVFCFGTRLTRVTRALDRRRPDDALQRAGAGRVRLGGRHPDRGQPGRLRPGLGTARPGPRRDRGHLLRRPGPGRPGGAGHRDGAAGPAQPPDRLAEPAQGREPGLPAQHPGHDGGRAAHRRAAVRARSVQPGRTRYAAANPVVKACREGGPGAVERGNRGRG